MRRSDTLDLCLMRYAREGDPSLDPLLAALGSEQLIVPVIMHSDNSETSSSSVFETFRVPTFDSADVRLLPIFTSPERFSAWSSGRYESVQLLGADLNAVVPQGTWVMINPGDELSVKLEPRHVAGLSDISDESEMESEEEFRNSPAPDLLRDLATLLLRYPEVEEAYCFVDLDRDSEGAVGLLAPNLSASRRFSLVGEIAEVSRQYFGMAGSLEVFDDLHVKTSRSWDLFSSFAPFYHRELSDTVADEAASRASDALEDRVEVERQRKIPQERELFFSRKKSLLGRIFG